MKSNICNISKDRETLKSIISEVEACGAYNQLEKKSSMRLQLLAEELCGLIPQLVEFSDGNFWIENNKNRYELHTCIKVDTRDSDYRERVLAISTSGKNAAEKGIMGKIRAAIETMVEISADPEYISDLPVYEMGAYPSNYYSHAWSLVNYKNQVEDTFKDNGESEEWDELEKSIIANLADDVIVGIQKGKVEIIIKKRF